MDGWMDGGMGSTSRDLRPQDTVPLAIDNPGTVYEDYGISTSANLCASRS